MADNSQFYINGYQKWDVKQTPQSMSLIASGNQIPPVSIPPFGLIGLVGTSILTDIQNISFKIVRGVDTLAHVLISNYVAHELNSSVITIQTQDSHIMTLTFVSSMEAAIGDSRIVDCINGLNVT